jgi:hypothetical protein
MVPPRSGREWGWEGLRASKSGQDKVVPVGLGIPGIIKAGVREGLSPIDRGKPCHNRGTNPRGVRWIQIHNLFPTWWGILRHCMMESKV